jgi:hypothetical protein
MAGCLAWFIGLGWLTVSTLGCRQILDLHDRPEAPDAGPTVTQQIPGSGNGDSDASVDGGTNTLVPGQCGGLLHPSASCASCMDQDCCAAARACAGDPACVEASNCLAACQDATCEARCAEFYALPDTLIALRACRVGQCASACASTCGEFASAVPGCQACQQAMCCSQGTACASNKDCAALNLCVSGCFDTVSCPSDCQTTYPLGATAFQAWQTCTNQCASACQPGQSWECLATPVAWPKAPPAGTITFSVTFVNFTAEAPFVGSAVKACSKLDLTCQNPLDVATTDASGTVTVTVPAGLSGFDGYLDVSGGKAGGTGSPVFPALWYPVPFIVADGSRGPTTLLGADEFTTLTMATGTTLDPNRGHITLNAVDCAFGPAAGVSFVVDSADQSTVSYYLIGGVPTTTAMATDQYGIGAFINVPTTLATMGDAAVATPKLAVVRAFSAAAGGKSMGSLTFVVRPGTQTTSSSFPPIPPP